MRPNVEKWLKEHRIKNYTINDDLTIDVKGGVHLYGYKEKQLPEYIQFGRVDRSFNIGASNLTTLVGCPQYVGGDFYYCSCNKKITLKDVQNNCAVRGDIIF